MRELSFLIAAYLIGSFPSGYLAGRAAGVDVSSRGSGNLGATNVLRVVGPGWASAVLLVDGLKGFLPVWLFPLWDGSALPGLAVGYGAVTVAGHVWSVFLRFRGGKGVATGGGALLGVAPLTAVVTVLVWVGLVLLTRTASVASLVAATSAPLVAAWLDTSWSAVGFAAVMASLVWWTHRDNLRRMRRGDEHRFDAASVDAGNGERSG